MARWKSDDIKNYATRVTAGLVSVTLRRRAVIDFARQHKLIYFRSVSAGGQFAPVIVGSTASPDQVDTNFSIGTHAGYDLALLERMGSITYEGYKSTQHRWYVLQIDLHKANNLPFIFIGTRQQTKAYYARVLATHRHVRYLTVDSGAARSSAFHSQYAVIASPAELPQVYRLLNDENIDIIAANKQPFAVEIDGDTLSVITEATRPSQQLLDKLLHYGLWLAKEADSRLA